MLVVETIAKIRRAFFVQKKSIKEICRDLRAGEPILLETRPLTRLGLERVGYAMLSTEGRAGSDPGASFHEGRYGIICLKLRFTRGAAAAAIFGT
jgi:hypothetical protein